MVNLGARITDIISNPMSSGFGAGINQKTTATKTTTQKKTTSNNNISSVLTSTKKTSTNQTIAQKTQTTVKSSSDIVNLLLKNTVDSLLQDKTKKEKASTATNQDLLYNTAYAYYKKLYGGDLISTNDRNKTEKNIDNIINKGTNDKIVINKAGTSAKTTQVLTGSKLQINTKATVVETLINLITNPTNKETDNKNTTVKETTNKNSVKNQTVTNSWSDNLLKNLDVLQTSTKERIAKTSETSVKNTQKQREAVTTKIKTYEETKQQYEKTIANLVSGYKTAIAAEIEKMTKELTSSLGNVINLKTTSSIKL